MSLKLDSVWFYESWDMVCFLTRRGGKDRVWAWIQSINSTNERTFQIRLEFNPDRTNPWRSNHIPACSIHNRTRPNSVQIKSNERRPAVQSIRDPSHRMVTSHYYYSISRFQKVRWTPHLCNLFLREKFFFFIWWIITLLAFFLHFKRSQKNVHQVRGNFILPSSK
jgi:hypothetical protein